MRAMGAKTLSWLLILFLSAPKEVVAEGGWAQKLYLMPSERGISQIPTQPSQPPGLTQKQFKQSGHCERFFLFEGKRYECDSNLGGDAERLRPILQDVPAAIAELDQYQKSRSDVRVSGHLITSALVLAGLGMLFSGGQPFNPSNGGLTPGGAVVLTGMTLGVGAIVHGFTVVNSSDKHIENAVHFYNAAHPDHPVDLQFKTGIGSRLIQ